MMLIHLDLKLQSLQLIDLFMQVSVEILGVVSNQVLKALRCGKCLYTDPN